MKTMTYLRFILLLSLPLLAAPFSYGQTSPSVKSTSCKLLGPSQIEFTDLRLNRKLATPVAAPQDFPICHKVTWNNITFLTVKYPISIPVSYSGKVKRVLNYVIYRVENSRLIQMSADFADEQRPVWTTQKNHLVFRWQSRGKNGKPVLGKGYVYIAKTKSFEDYVVYSFKNRWKTVE